MLGGCSSHNDMVSLRLPAYDCHEWEKIGITGWDFKTFQRLFDKVRIATRDTGAHPRDRNDLCEDYIRSGQAALDLEFVPNFNAQNTSKAGPLEGIGWAPVSYDPQNGHRSSASVAYIHPILLGHEKRPNLTILTRAWVDYLNVEGDVVKGVNLRLNNGERRVINARVEVTLCAGAIDTPRLLLLSGLGPKEQLQSLDIPVIKDIPGVGENLQDHPNTTMVFALKLPAPTNTAMNADVVWFMRSAPYNSEGGDGNIPDIQVHMWQLDFCQDTKRLGYEVPEHPFCILPGPCRPKSVGRLYLKSKDPTVNPGLDFRYFSDEGGYDEKLLVEGLKAARKLAQSPPFSNWIEREIAPGPQIQTEEELSAYGRAVSSTVYHPACTTKMGDLDKDPLAVVDCRLKVRGFRNLRIADAGILPMMVSVNPMVTVLGIGERAAEMIAEDAGYSISTPSVHL